LVPFAGNGRFVVVTSGDDARAIAIVSPYDMLAERFVLHATRLLPSFVDETVYLSWHRLYPGASAVEVLRHFRNFLVDAWLKETDTANPYELAVLSFDDADVTIEHLTTVIRAILTRLGATTVVAVIEIVAAVDTTLLTAIQAAAHAMQRSTLSTLTIVFVGSQAQLARAFSPRDALTLSLERVPLEWRNVFARQQPQSASVRAVATSGRTIAPELLELVVPLSALQSGASRDVVSYIATHMRASQDEVDSFVRDHFVVPLLNDGMSLGERGYQAATDGRQHVRGYEEVVSNGARVVAFVPPENLLKVSTLAAIEKYVNTNFRLIDVTGAMLSAAVVGNDHAEAKRLAIALSDDVQRNAGLFQRSNEYHHATLIKYLSQLLMRPRYNMDATFFGYLERLSRGFAEYLVQSVTPRSEGLYRASRLMTNVGYVYDHMPAARKAAVQVRREIFSRAADLLTEHTPARRQDVIRFGYAEGWQRWDAGDVDGAKQVFLRTAKQLTADTSDVLDAQPDSTVFILAGIIFAFDGGRPRNEFVESAMEALLRRCPLFDRIDDIRRLLFSPPYTVDLRDRYFGIEPSVALYFTPIDVAAAIQTATFLIYDRGLSLRMHVVSETAPFQPDAQHLVHIIIGAPDTPGPIGSLISEINPTAAYLFQVKSTEDFSDIDVVRYRDRDFITTSGAGLATVNTWVDFWNRRPPLKEQTMDPFSIGVIVSTLLGAAGSRLSELFVDRVIEKARAFISSRNDGQIDAKAAADL
jgi:hypothetical protein